MRSRLSTVILAAFALAFPILMLTAATPPMAVVEDIPQLNSAGDAVYASLEVNDGTGVVTTVTTGGTLQTMTAGSPLTAGEDDGSGCITASATTGKFTIASRCGVGEIELVACFNDIIGIDAKTVQATWQRTRSGSTTSVGPTLRDIQASTAVRHQAGCIRTIHDASLSDTYQVAVTSTSDSDTLTIRAASLSARKILSK